MRSDTISLLCDIAVRTRRKITWDPKTTTIVGGDEATKLMHRDMRAPLDTVASISATEVASHTKKRKPLMRQNLALVTTALIVLSLVAWAVAAGPATMDASRAQRTRYPGTVAIWYSGHFEDSVAHDWVPIKEWNGPYHPLLGDYKTGDSAVVRKHLQWMRRAGVDVIVYDVVRVQPN